MLEGHIVLAVLLGGLRFTPASDAIIEPEPRMTLRPSGAVTMFVTKGARHE
jgi:cytochrome P450